MPSGSVVVVNEQDPELSVQLPSTVAPLLKVTFPVAADGEMAALNVTELPKVEDGPGLAVS